MKREGTYASAVDSTADSRGPDSRGHHLGSGQPAEDVYEEPEWARGLGLHEANMREAFVQVGDMVRNMSATHAELVVPHPDPIEGEPTEGGVTFDAPGAGSESRVRHGDAMGVRYGRAQWTVSVRTAMSSLDEIVKQVLRAIIAQGQRVLQSTR